MQALLYYLVFNIPNTATYLNGTLVKSNKLNRRYVVVVRQMCDILCDMMCDRCVICYVISTV